MYDSEKIAERITLMAKAQKITLRSLLSACSLGVNTISELRKGREISFASLALIADQLGCSVDYLLGRTDNPQINR